MNKKTLIFLGIAAAGGFLFYYFSKTQNQLLQQIKNFGGGKDKSNSETNTDIPQVIKQSPDFPLKLGSRGDKVRDVQMFINAAINAQKQMPGTQPGDSMTTISTDGIWGAQTQTALTALNMPASISAEKYYEIKQKFD